MVSTIAGYGPAVGLCTLLTVQGGVALATDTPSNTLYQLDIPEEQLRDALQALALSANRKLFYRSSIVQRVISRPLKGQYTLDQAISALLRGTDLHYKITPSGVILIDSTRASLFSRLGKAVTAMLAALSLGVPVAALAQNPADQQPPQATGQLKEVVVTAERRSTDIMSTPISVAVLSGDQLQESKVVDINSLGQVAPNLLVVNSGLNSTANIRGIGNSNQGGDEVQGVAIVHDGLPNGTAGFGDNVPYFDIADIEVLRGPQGTFTAANSTGGTININTANPNFRGINGYVDVTAATYSEQRVQGAINLPATNTLALRLAVNEETRGSFFRDQGSLINGPYEAGPAIAATGNSPSSADQATYDPGNVHDQDARLGLLWQPTDNFQMLTKIGLYFDDSEGIPTQPSIYPFSPLAPGLPCPGGHVTTAAGDCLASYAQGYSGYPYQRNDWASFMTKANTDVANYLEDMRYTLPSGIVLRSLTGVQEINQTIVQSTSHDNLDVGSFAQVLDHTPIYSEEINAISPATGPFSWIAGASYYYFKWDFNRYTVNVHAPFSPANPQIGTYTDGSNNSSASEAVFGQVSWQFTPTLKLQAGGRMTWDRNWNVCNGNACKGAGLITNILYAPGRQYIRITPGPAPSDHVPTGKIDLSWTPRPGQLFYGFVARGFKQGENNAGNTPPAHYEWVTDYEAGWKSRLMDNHMNLQVDGYYMQYEDMIHSTFDPYLPTSTAEANIPSSILKGIEVALDAHLGRLSVALNAAYNKSILGPFKTAARYKFPTGTFFGTTPQCAPGVAPSNTATGCSDYTPYIVNLSGEPLPNSPQYTFNATLRYSIPVGDWYVVPRVQYSYRDKAYSDIFQSDNYYLLPGYSLWSAYLDWDAGPWTTSVFGTNLANSVYLEGTGLYGNPRQLGLEVRRTF